LGGELNWQDNLALVWFPSSVGWWTEWQDNLMLVFSHPLLSGGLNWHFISHLFIGGKIKYTIKIKVIL